MLTGRERNRVRSTSLSFLKTRPSASARLLCWRSTGDWSRSYSLGGVISLSGTPRGYNGSYYQGTSTTVFGMRLCGVLLFPVSRVGFSFQNGLHDIAGRIACGLCSTVPISQDVRIHVCIIRGGFSAILHLVTRLLFRLRTSVCWFSQTSVRF